jgi:hypothetical protein
MPSVSTVLPIKLKAITQAAAKTRKTTLIHEIIFVFFVTSPHFLMVVIDG